MNLDKMLCLLHSYFTKEQFYFLNSNSFVLRLTKRGHFCLIFNIIFPILLHGIVSRTFISFDHLYCCLLISSEFSVFLLLDLFNWNISIFCGEYQFPTTRGFETCANCKICFLSYTFYS